jgi:predicted nucleic acid-binding protein
VILVDTSVWVQHLRVGEAHLAAALDQGLVLSHPWVIGELALGQLHHRAEVLGLLHRLPQAPVATAGELLELIARHRLQGTGIGYVDAQLLAATLLAPRARLWSLDKRLRAVATRLGQEHVVSEDSL